MSLPSRSVGRRFILLLLVLGAQVVTSAAVPSASYAAESCSDEHTIFWGAWEHGSTHFRGSTNGTENHIILQNRTLDSSCTNHGVAWSTAHLMMGDQNNQAELGYSLHLDSAGSKYLVWFEELQVAGHGNSFDNTTWPCNGTPAYGTNVGYRVQNISGTNDWKFYINCADGSGWNLAGALDNGSDSIGTPMGETGRRENTWGATGMMDDQSGLSYLKSGTWSNDWDYPKCYTDPQNDNNWEGVKVVGSPTEYYTQQGTGWCNNS